MDNYTVGRDTLLKGFPIALRKDEIALALGETTAEALAGRMEEIEALRIFSRIDELPEALLDILAYDFKVDWWDYRYTVEQKRQTLKGSFLVHKRLGTKYAVKTALSAVYPNSTIQEWFEYGGDPYTFRLLVNVSGQQVDSEMYFRAIDLINFYKNLRSHLRGVEYIIEAKEPATLRTGGQFAAVVKLRIPELGDAFQFDDTVQVGGQVSSIATIPIPEVADELRFAHTERMGGQTSAVTRLSVPALPDGIAFSRELRMGGRTAAVTSIPLPVIPDEP